MCPGKKRQPLSRYLFCGPAANIELARKASMARRQGLKPAIRPAAKDGGADEYGEGFETIFRSDGRGAITVDCEFSLVKAGDRTITNIIISKIAVMQYLALCIPV